MDMRVNAGHPPHGNADCGCANDNPTNSGDDVLAATDGSSGQVPCLVLTGADEQNLILIVANSNGHPAGLRNMLGCHVTACSWNVSGAVDPARLIPPVCQDNLGRPRRRCRHRRSATGSAFTASLRTGDARGRGFAMDAVMRSAGISAVPRSRKSRLKRKNWLRTTTTVTTPTPPTPHHGSGSPSSGHLRAAAPVSVLTFGCLAQKKQ